MDDDDETTKETDDATKMTNNTSNSDDNYYTVDDAVRSSPPVSFQVKVTQDNPEQISDDVFNFFAPRYHFVVVGSLDLLSDNPKFTDRQLYCHQQQSCFVIGSKTTWEFCLG